MLLTADVRSPAPINGDSKEVADKHRHANRHRGQHLHAQPIHRTATLQAHALLAADTAAVWRVHSTLALNMPGGLVQGSKRLLLQRVLTGEIMSQQQLLRTGRCAVVAAWKLSVAANTIITSANVMIDSMPNTCIPSQHRPHQTPS